MRKILVLRGGALGDFIVTLPALALLRARWPNAQIELIGNATAALLARARGLLDAVHSQHEARWSALFSDETLPSALAAWLGEFDLVINYWPDSDGTLRHRFPVRAGQTYLQAEAMPARAPAAAHYCEPLRAVGLDATEYFFRMNPVAPPVSAGTFPPLTRRARMSVHPGSGSPRKNWPRENWLSLIEQLPAPISLILGEAETDLVGPALACGELVESVAEPRHADKRQPYREAAENITRLVNRPLEELVAHFSRCRLFLGHDSGISHLAAACGAPSVLLFGPTDPAIWAPPAPNVRVLQRGPALNSISVAEVRHAVEALLADQT
jgi:heptosyltransferase III